MRAISIQSPLKVSLVILSLSFSMFLGACSTNPATGERQFASFMSPEKENQVGAQEHAKILKQFGGLYKNKAVTDYVQAVGQKVAKNTERPDVQYRFFVLDTPEANAFAVPGGYVYITRGILALASDESELAAVLGHEVGHITGRHSAERYSHSIVTGIGATLLGAAVNSPDAGQLVNMGASLYLNSYSRSQESEADMLGVRYLSRSGYDTTGMTRFLKTLGAYTQLDARANGKASSQTPVYFSTHPLNADRVEKTVAEAAKYTGGSATARNKNDYLKKIMGLPWGSSAAQGYVRGNTFVHPELGFKFTAPAFAKIVNKPSEVIISAQNQENQGVAVLDMATSKQALSAAAYIQYEWMNEEPLQLVEPIKINGLDAATAVFPGHVNGRAAQIRLVAIQWAPDKFFRFQIALPSNISSADNNAYKSMTYSFERIKKENLGSGDAISLVHARSGDTVGSLSQLQNKVFEQYSSEYFKVLNGLIDPRDNIRVGDLYKVIKRD